MQLSQNGNSQHATQSVSKLDSLKFITHPLQYIPHGHGDEQSGNATSAMT